MAKEGVHGQCIAPMTRGKKVKARARRLRAIERLEAQLLEPQAHQDDVARIESHIAETKANL